MKLPRSLTFESLGVVYGGSQRCLRLVPCDASDDDFYHDRNHVNNNGGTGNGDGLTILPGCSKVIFASVHGRAMQPQKKRRRRAGSIRGTLSIIR